MQYKNLKKTMLGIFAAGLLASPYVCEGCANSYTGKAIANTKTEQSLERTPEMPQNTIDNIMEED